MNKDNRARMKRIEREFKEAFKTFTKHDKGIVMFGSARTSEDNPEYKFAYELAFNLGMAGYTVLTGGGKGVMEASNKGAYSAGAKSIGLNIKLPYEQCSNKYTTKSMTFKYFFIRKFFLTYLSKVTIVLPGGWGTMDEAYEHLTLAQTGKIKQRPIIFIRNNYYKDMMKWWDEVLFKVGAIGHKERSFVHLVDNIEEVLKILENK